MSCYNGRVPVEALAHRSWPPIQKNHNTHTLTKKVQKNKKKQKNVQKWHVRASAAAHLWRGNVRGVQKLEAECLGGECPTLNTPATFCGVYRLKVK